jgi:hypothetical protein
VSTASFHFAGATRNWPTSLIKPNWSDTSPPGCVQVCRARPCTHRVAALTLRSAVEESDFWLRAGATAPGTMPADPAKGGGVGMKHQPALRFSLRCEAGRRLCFRDITQHTLSVRSFVPHSHINSFRADDSPCRDPSARNLCQTMWRCVQSRCFTVTARATRTSHSSGALMASAARTAPVRRHPSRQRRRFACNANSRVCNPKDPRPSPQRDDPFRPQGVCA